MKPSNFKAHFTGMGLLSANKAAVSGANIRAIPRAPASLPQVQAECSSSHKAGTRLETTEMQPSPPAARNSTTVASSQMGRARQYIVPWFVRIGAKMVAKPQFRLGLGHDLQQPDGAFRRQCACVASALHLHDGADPMRGHAEALRGIDNQ
jgi:hypothetical protein